MISTVMAAESPENQMVRLAQNEFYFGRTVPMQSVIDRIDTVSTSDLLSMADARWRKTGVALTMLGPDAEDGNMDDRLVI